MFVSVKKFLCFLLLLTNKMYDRQNVWSYMKYLTCSNEKFTKRIKVSKKKAKLNI